jgi:hypothetical protein
MIEAMPALPSRRSPLGLALFASVAAAFSACGGTSVRHEPTDEAGTSSDGGTPAQGATGGTTSGAGGKGSSVGGSSGSSVGGSSGSSVGGSSVGGSSIGGSSVGGSSVGGTLATTGGAGGTTAGMGGGVVTGGTSGSASGGAAGTSALTCDDVRRKTESELERIQYCTTDAECGQVLVGTSCGCTRNLVARFDADATAFHELKGQEVNGERCNEFTSSCDCPNAVGFVCAGGRCAWNYMKDEPPEMCTAVTMASMCVVGVPIDSGDALVAGMPLTLAFQPAGCFSSSCTKVVSASCDMKRDGNDFNATADMCLTQASDPNVGCTDDCGGGGQLTCESEYLLTEGTHTVRYAGGSNLSVTFTVPSVVNDGSLCAVTLAR